MNLVPTLLLVLPTLCHGWGTDGHELVGNLAYRLLNSQTQAIVQKILVNHPFSSSSTNTPLGEVADWADQVRIHRDYHWSGALHYIDIHDSDVEGGCPVYDRTDAQKQACHFVYERDCAQDVCVAGSIVNYTHHLGDYWNGNDNPQLVSNHNSRLLRGSAALLSPWSWGALQTTTDPTNLVQESLMFLTHFVGDIHQPLHSARESDRGGNTITVTFEVPQSSHHHHQELHAVWDTSIIERAIHTEYNHNRDALEEELLGYIHKSQSSGEMNKWLECPDTSDKKCTSQWAEESWQNALQWAYANTDGHSEVTPGTHLGDDYYQTRWTHIQHYIAVAGVRLAAALELVLGGHDDDDTALLSLKEY